MAIPEYATPDPNNTDSSRNLRSNMRDHADLLGAQLPLEVALDTCRPVRFTAAHLDGLLIPGSVFTWTENGFAIESTLLKVEPARYLAWRGHAVGTDAVHDWQIERGADGVMVTATETFSGWLPTLLPGTMQQQLDDALPPWLDALKSKAEKPE